MRGYREALVHLISIEWHILTSIDVENRTCDVVWLPRGRIAAGGTHPRSCPRSA